LGVYTLDAEAAGFESLRKEIRVSATTVDLSLTLRVGGVEQSVIVTAPIGYAIPNADAGTKIDMPLMETPMAVQVIGRQVIDDQQTVNLVDVLTNVSGVAPTNDGYGTSDSFSIRGFDAASMLYQDGMKLDQYGASGFPQDMANVEQIQVVKGPASVLYGQAEPGGLVAVVTKHPQPGPFASVGQEMGNHRFFRTTADVNRPLVKDKLLFRIALDGTDAGSFRDFIHTNEFSLYPSASWRITPNLGFTLLSSYQRGSNILDNGIPFLSNGRPANVPRSSNYMDLGTNKSNIDQFSLEPSINLRLAEQWTLRMQYKVARINAPLPVDEYYQGDVDASGNLQRGAFIESSFHHRSDQVLADLPGKFSFGPVKNSFLLGFDFFKQTGGWFGNTSLQPAAINIYQPVYDQPYGTADPSGDIFAVQGAWEYGAYIQDVVELPGRVFVLAGTRLNWTEEMENITTPEPFSYSPNDVHEKPVTPRAGLLWQPKTNVSFYGSYTSNYGASALFVYTADGKPLRPQSANQVEFGIKSEWLDRRLTATAAAYRIIKHNVPTADPKNPLYTEAIGTARTEGVELDLSGQLTRSLRIIGGLSSLQAITTNDTNTPSLQGLPFPGVPHNIASLWGVWEPQSGPLRGFRLGAGTQTRSGEQAYESPDGLTYLADRIPSFGIANLMTAYEHTYGKAHISAQINVDNLFNSRYFATVNPSQAMPGTPFSILPTLRIAF
jgi:iron complex outermembrane receptor protein